MPGEDTHWREMLHLSERGGELGVEWLFNGCILMARIRSAIDLGIAIIQWSRNYRITVMDSRPWLGSLCVMNISRNKLNYADPGWLLWQTTTGGHVVFACEANNNAEANKWHETLRSSEWRDIVKVLVLLVDLWNGKTQHTCLSVVVCKYTEHAKLCYFTWAMKDIYPNFPQWEKWSPKRV